MRDLVPREILTRKKMGFPVPTARWFRGELAPWLREVLLDGPSGRCGFFTRGRIETMLAEHASGRVSHADQLWQILNFELWHDTVYRGRWHHAPGRSASTAGRAAP